MTYSCTPTIKTFRKRQSPRVDNRVYRQLTTFVYRIVYLDYVINQLVTQRYNQRVINIDIQLLLIDVWFYDRMVITNINHMSPTPSKWKSLFYFLNFPKRRQLASASEIHFVVVLNLAEIHFRMTQLGR
jgi:hypothetical protein